MHFLYRNLYPWHLVVRTEAENSGTSDCAANIHAERTSERNTYIHIACKLLYIHSREIHFQLHLYGFFLAKGKLHTNTGIHWCHPIERLF